MADLQPHKSLSYKCNSVCRFVFLFLFRRTKYDVDATSVFAPVSLRVLARTNLCALETELLFRAGEFTQPTLEAGRNTYGNYMHA